MRLIDDIRQQVAVADDGFPCGQGGPNHFFDKLHTGCHVQQHFRAAMDGRVVMVEQNLPQFFAQRRAAGIAAGHDLAALLRNRAGQQSNLRRFADAIHAVEGKKHQSVDFSREGTTENTEHTERKSDNDSLVFEFGIMAELTSRPTRIPVARR